MATPICGRWRVQRANEPQLVHAGREMPDASDQSNFATSPGDPEVAFARRVEDVVRYASIKLSRVCRSEVGHPLQVRRGWEGQLWALHCRRSAQNVCHLRYRQSCLHEVASDLFRIEPALAKERTTSFARNRILHPPSSVESCQRIVAEC